MTPGALPIPEAAKYLGISRSQLYRISAECGARDDLRPVHIGGRRVFRVKDLDAYLERHLVPASDRRSA